MRQMIRIVEARAPKARPRPVADLGALRTVMSEVVTTLARAPFGVRYDRCLSDALAAQAREIRQQSVADATGEPGIVPMTLEEALDEAMQRLTGRVGKVGCEDFAFVAREIEHEEHGENNQGGGYQSRRAEAAGRADDLDFWIEDSDYLRAMAGQKALASALSRRDFNDPADTLEALDLIQRFARTFDEHSHVTDGGEQPFLVDSMAEGLGKLMPLLKLRWSAA